MGDDAVGPYVIALLKAKYHFDSSVSVCDLGTPGLALLEETVRADALIVVDTVQSDGEAGEVRHFRKTDLRRMAAAPRLNPHAPALADTLGTAGLAGRGPQDVFLVGIVPARIEQCLGLSDPVTLALPRVVAEIVGELERLGVPPRRRAIAARPDIWWEVGVDVERP
jgi:hydrogenase maturation protease